MTVGLICRSVPVGRVHVYLSQAEPGKIYPGFSLDELLHYCALIGRKVHSVATPALLCHKEPATSKKNSPIANGGILRSKAPGRGFWMPELFLYGIRVLAPAIPRTSDLTSTSRDQSDITCK